MFGCTSFRPNLIAHFHSMKKTHFVFNEDTKNCVAGKARKMACGKPFLTTFCLQPIIITHLQNGINLNYSQPICVMR